MPAEEVFGERTWAMLGTLPPRLAASTDYRALIHAEAREVELLEARLDQVRRQFNPLTADVLLKGWEALVHVTREPVGVTIEGRRATVVTLLRAIVPDPRGSTWEALITQLVGAGWDYQEHIPGDPSTPPEGTVRVVLPVPTTSDAWARDQRLIRARTPPHIALVLVSSFGFLWDRAHFDVDDWD